MGLEDKDEKVAKMLATIGTLEKDDLISLINHYETVWALTEDKGSINVQHMVGFNEGQFFDEADVDKTTVPPFPKKIEMRDVEDKSNRLFLMFKQIGARLNVLFDEKEDRLSWLHTDEMPALSLGERINRLIKQVSDAFSRVRQACTAMNRITDPRAAPERYDADPEYFSATPITSPCFRLGYSSKCLDIDLHLFSTKPICSKNSI